MEMLQRWGRFAKIAYKGSLPVGQIQYKPLPISDKGLILGTARAISPLGRKIIHSASQKIYRQPRIDDREAIKTAEDGNSSLLFDI